MDVLKYKTVCKEMDVIHELDSGFLVVVEALMVGIFHGAVRKTKMVCSLMGLCLLCAELFQKVSIQFICVLRLKAILAAINHLFNASTLYGYVCVCECVYCGYLASPMHVCAL